MPETTMYDTSYCPEKKDKIACFEAEEKIKPTCCVCTSTDGVKRYITKRDGIFYPNTGDGYVQVCRHHAFELGYIKEVADNE